MARLFLITSLLVLWPAEALAWQDIHAEVKFQQDGFFARDGDLFERLAGDSVGLTSASFRLKVEGAGHRWSYNLQYLTEADYSSRFEDIGLFSSAFEPSNYLDLENQILTGSEGQLDHRIDRGWVAYTTSKFVFRAGRQALTWGHGQVFRPLDLFNPFAPDATDTSYKPGTDMVYGQYLFDNGGDIQVLAVPRRNANQEFDADRSSWAVKGFRLIGSIESEIVLARDYGDDIVAAGFSGPIGDGLWKSDLVATFEDGGRKVVSGVASYQDSWFWKKRPITGFIEYHRNGFGVSDRRSLVELPDDLTRRITRGQVFNTGRDLLAIGGTIQANPLLQIIPVLIANLNDGSMLGIASTEYNLSDGCTLVGGIQMAVGSRNTEFGGREVTPGADLFDRLPSRAFLRLEVYF